MLSLFVFADENNMKTIFLRTPTKVLSGIAILKIVKTEISQQDAIMQEERITTKLTYGRIRLPQPHSK